MKTIDELLDERQSLCISLDSGSITFDEYKKSMKIVDMLLEDWYEALECKRLLKLIREKV